MHTARIETLKHSATPATTELDIADAAATAAATGAPAITRRAAIATVALAAAAAGLATTTTGCSSSSASYEGTSTETTDTGIACVHDYVGTEVDTVRSWITSSVYNEEAQQSAADALEVAKDGQTIDAPLVEYNPFGTNTLSLYVYFTTADEASVSYTVSVADDQVAAIDDETLTYTSIPDFVHDANGGESSTEHEFQLIGLIPGVTNTVTLTATYADGTTEASEFTCDMCGLLGDEELQLAMTDGTSTAELESGLFAILGNDDANVDFMYYYDNDGLIRGEIPIIEYRSHRLLWDDEGLMYFSVEYNNMVAMSPLGQIMRFYDLGNYSLHHDYAFDGDGNLLILATDLEADTVEDMIITLDVETGDVSLTLDMGDLMPDYKADSLAYHEENATEQVYDEGIDWIHFNTIQYIGDDQILLSSRETSSIIKISDVYGEPAIEYMLCSHDYWEGTDYDQYVYDQVGDFTVQGGQHSITYVEDDSLDEGQYYIYLFNNNIGISYDTTSPFDYSSIGLTETGYTNADANSYYYKYLVDENACTFELVDSFPVPYSGYVSSAQELESNILVHSGCVGTWTEYDENHDAIRTYVMEDEYFIYRVYKYDL